MSTKKSRQFVLLSDLHAHAWSAFAKGDGAENSRLKASLKILDKSLAKARELGVPWVFAGDIVHTAGYTLNTVLAGLTEVLQRYPKVEKIAVWGNHDARGIGGKITLEQTVLATLSKVVPRFSVLDPSQVIALSDPITGLTFSGAGYQPHVDLLEYGQVSDVGIYHQTIRGTKTPNGFVLEEGVEARELRKRHRVVIVGHVHHWQYHSEGLGPAQLFLIPGSPEHHNFGDTGEHGWWVITVPEAMMPDEPKAEFIAGGSPEFRTVDSPSAVKNDGHFYRVSGNVAGNVLPEGAIAIASTPDAIASRDVLKGARGEEALSAWLKAEPPEAKLPIDRYLEIGRGLLGSHEIGNLISLRLTRMMLRNFCSYDSETIQIRPGTRLVIGRGRDFPSNGAGKSTLFEAIFWGLFGRTTKGLTGDEVIRWGKDSCEVILDFEGELDAWLQVRRSRGEKSQLAVEYGTGELTTGHMEAKSVNELTEKLQNHLGLTPELYQALGYFSQEKLLLFASATDGERKDMLADLIGLSAYQEASSAAQQKCALVEIELQRLDAVKSNRVQHLYAERMRLATTTAQSQAWESTRAERWKVADLSVLDFDRTLVSRREELLQEVRQSLGGSLAAREAAAHVEYEAASVISSESTNTPEDLTAAQNMYAEALANLKKIRALAEDTDSCIRVAKQRLSRQVTTLSEGKCPSCGQLIDKEHRERCLAPGIEEVKALQLKSYDLACQQQPILDAAIKAKTQLAEITAGVEVYQQKQQQTVRFKAAEKLLRDLETEAVGVEAAAQSQVSKTLSEHRAELVRRLNAIQGEWNPFTKELTATQERIAEAETDITHYGEQRIRSLEEIAVHDYWRRGFSKQGIQSLLVDEVAGLFNESRGMIFPALTQGVYDVQFSTVSQTSKGEWREKTEFQIYEHGQLVPYAALSGGQRRRIDVGVMLTLVKAVSKWMQVPGMLGILVLDEVFGFLDGSGAEGLMEALREMQEQIPTIFVVSHDPQLQALFPEVIVVEQDKDGVSRVLA